MAPTASGAEREDHSVMLLAFTIVIMLAAAYAVYNHGLSSSVFMLISVMLAGFMAFNLWEPLADWLDTQLQAGTFAGCEDLIALVLIFGVTLLALRVAIFSYLSRDVIELGKFHYLGAGAVGLVTGYFVAGFLICVMQTLPLDVNFFDFAPRGGVETPMRNLFPPDRVWLYVMRNAGAYPFHWQQKGGDEDDVADRYRGTFDRDATFELRYLRYRRTTEGRGPMPYFGEFDRELYGRQKQR